MTQEHSMARIRAIERRFHIRRCDEDAHHGHVVTERSAHAAAVAWLERHPDLTLCAGEISVVARDLENGREFRFSLMLDAESTST
jgi:hypothetical protein